MLQGRAHAQASLASLRAAYEGPDGVRDRALAALDAISVSRPDEISLYRRLKTPHPG
jgi:hypothetical protein